MNDKILSGHRVFGYYILMPMAEFVIPHDGRTCRGPAYWLVNSNNEVLFFRYYSSPQCNSSERVMKHLLAGHFKRSLTPDLSLRIEYIEMAYIPHRCADYV